MPSLRPMPWPRTSGPRPLQNWKYCILPQLDACGTGVAYYVIGTLIWPPLARGRRWWRRQRYICRRRAGGSARTWATQQWRFPTRDDRTGVGRETSPLQNRIQLQPAVSAVSAGRLAWTAKTLWRSRQKSPGHWRSCLRSALFIRVPGDRRSDTCGCVIGYRWELRRRITSSGVVVFTKFVFSCFVCITWRYK